MSQRVSLYRGLKRCFAIILIIASAALLFNFTPVKKMLDLNEIYRQKEFLLNTVQSNYLLSIFTYFFTYIILAGVTFPGSAIMSILAGFFFGPVAGFFLISISAATGAFIVFWLVRHFAGYRLQERYKDKLMDFNREIDNNGINYLISLRILPVMPFFLVNILAAFTRISSFTFLWTTLAGMIPGSLIYVYIGYTGSTMDKRGFLSPGIYAALTILGLLSILPVIIRKIRNSRPVK